jgi:tRNA threonylcarbamoyladenosine biosynthesis protein TsaE
MIDRRHGSERPPRSRESAEPSAAERTHTVFTLTEEETLELGRATGRGLRGGELVLLEGDLGLGKTVFARGIAAGLGVPPEEVSSPSFTLIQEYRGGRLLVYHVDLYRIHSDEELATLGLDEILDSNAVVVVEWGEKLAPRQRRDAIVVRFHDVGEGSRRIELFGRPDHAARRGDA